MSKKTYIISVIGCDDTTIIYKELTKTQAVFLKNIAAEITSTSTYGCEPEMSVEQTTKNNKQE